MVKKLLSNMFKQIGQSIKKLFNQSNIIDITQNSVLLLKALDNDIEDKKREVEILHQIYQQRKNEIEIFIPQLDSQIHKGPYIGETKYELLTKFEAFEESHIKELYDLYKSIEKLEFIKSLQIAEQCDLYKSFLQNPDHIFLKYRNHMHHSLGRERSSMPQVDTNDIDKFLIHFAQHVKVVPCQMALNDLKPAQGEFADDKILDKLTNDEWKTRKYLISKDNYLIDAHHSWAAGLEHDPSQVVDCYRVNLTAQELLRRTNLLKITRKEKLDGTHIAKSVAVFEGLEDKEVESFCKAYDSYLLIRDNEMEQLRADEMWKSITNIFSPSLKAYNESIDQIFK